LHTETQIAEGLLAGKLIHLALPVRWSLVAQDGRGPIEMGCTYDIHPRGARLVSTRAVNLGDLVMVERGRNRALCQVIWAGPRNSQLHGQFAVRCVDEGKTPWDEELRELEAQYQPVLLDAARTDRVFGRMRRSNENRRRRPRYQVEGKVDVVEGVQHHEGRVMQLSELGARIKATEPLDPGTDFRMLLNVFDVSVALKAQVKYLAGSRLMAVEFREIRRGDRPLLDYVLSQLKKAKLGEDFVKVEVVHDDRAVAAAG
jgi:PilZ domain